MFSQDYIVRMIRQAAAVLVQILGLKKARKYPEAGQAIRQALEGLTGLPGDLVEQLDDDSLIDHMRRPGGGLDLERLLLVAGLTHEQGEIFSLQGHPSQAAASYLRALKLYLEAALAEEEPVLPLDLSAFTPPEREAFIAASNRSDLAGKINAAASKLDLHSIPTETLFNLYLFYENSHDYAKAIQNLELLADALPGEQTVRQEQEEFFQRLLEKSDAELQHGGVNRAVIQARFKPS